MSEAVVEDLRTQLLQNRGVAHALVAYLGDSEALARSKAAVAAVEAMKTGDASFSRQGLHQLGTADALKTLREAVKTFAKLTDN
jgi:hypothetical protein